MEDAYNRPNLQGQSRPRRTWLYQIESVLNIVQAKSTRNRRGWMIDSTMHGGKGKIWVKIVARGGTWKVFSLHTLMGKDHELHVFMKCFRTTILA